MSTNIYNKKYIVLIVLMMVFRTLSFSKENQIYATDNRLKSLDSKINNMCENMQTKLDAKEIIIVIINSKDGSIISVKGKKSAINYIYQPAEVVYPVVFSILLDKALINPNDLINGGNGSYKIGNRVISDEWKFDWMPAKKIVTYSSHVGMAEIIQKISAKDLHEGFNDFKFGEEYGYLPSITQINKNTNKVTFSFGYGIHINLMQLTQAYNVFLNNGVSDDIQIIKKSTAFKIKEILIESVNEGTGKKAKMEALTVGGKTGTAYIFDKGKHVGKFNHSFIGFVEGETEKYTIGVLVVEPKNSQYASNTATVIFKKSIEIMLENHFLRHCKKGEK